MIALTVVASIGILSLQMALGIAIGIALGILIANLAAPRVKKFAAVVALALALAAAFDHVGRARAVDEKDVVILNPCKGRTWSDWDYWANGCFWP